jgi:hypothetical protein
MQALKRVKGLLADLQKVLDSGSSPDLVKASAVVDDIKVRDFRSIRNLEFVLSSTLLVL